MRHLELRRHSLRQRQNPHLCQAGIDLARRVGREIGPFDCVISSPSIRTQETGRAMGFDINELYEPVAFTEEQYLQLGELMPEGTSLADIALQMQSHPLAIRYAQALRDQWQQVAERLQERQAALVLTHGGYIDCSAVACLPHANHESWGESLSHCEGIRLAFDEGIFTEGGILRVDPIDS